MLTMNYTAAAARFDSRLRAYGNRVREQGEKQTHDQMVSTREVIVQTTPVDTGALQKDWGPVTQRGPLTWGVSNSKDYAVILEYGGYRKAGPRTAQLGGGALGEDFVASAGVYSKQAPLGWVRRALAAASAPWNVRLQQVMRQAWEGR